MTDQPQPTHKCPQCKREYIVSHLTHFIIRHYRNGGVVTHVSKTLSCRICKGVELKEIKNDQAIQE